MIHYDQENIEDLKAILEERSRRINMKKKEGELEMYVCHTRYKKKGASGREYNIARGERFDVIANFIACDNAAICSIRSEDAYKYFAIDDDGKGLERGELTHDIAYSDRRPNKNNGYRFTEAQIEVLEKEFKKFLRSDVDTILFNHEFFNADVDELKTLKQRLQEVQSTTSEEESEKSTIEL